METLIYDLQMRIRNDRNTLYIRGCENEFLWLLLLSLWLFRIRVTMGHPLLLSQAFSRKLAGKWSIRDTNQCSYETLVAVGRRLTYMSPCQPQMPKLLDEILTFMFYLASQGPQPGPVPSFPRPLHVSLPPIRGQDARQEAGLWGCWVWLWLGG